MLEHGSTSTWDDWLVTRSDTGDQFADGVARALLDSNFRLEQLDFGAEGTRRGFRQLFDEFESATEGQQIRGRSMMMKRKAPDIRQVNADHERRMVTVTYGEPSGPGMFMPMTVPEAVEFAGEIVAAAQSVEGAP